MTTTGSRPSIGWRPHASINLLLLLATGAWPGPSFAMDDPYERYVRHSKDFHAVQQDKAWCAAAFPSWTYMPWTHRWSIGYDATSAAWAREHGYNGGFVDGIVPGLDDANRERLAWVDRYDFRFYLDHAAGKRRLHLWDGDSLKAHQAELHGVGLRPVPINAALRDELRGKIRMNLAAVGSSPRRAAYALDDEISWGHFVHPTMWRITDEAAAYPAWLAEVYGPVIRGYCRLRGLQDADADDVGQEVLAQVARSIGSFEYEPGPAGAPQRSGWMTYEDLRPRLASWSVRQFDASPLMDQWTFNDSWWNNFVGDQVEYANEVDPRTPCGFVGGQAPNAFGGYDYAKVMRKVQFLESYNVGSSQAIKRSR